MQLSQLPTGVVAKRHSGSGILNVIASMISVTVATRRVIVTTVVAGFLAGLSGMAEAALTVDNGFLSGATVKGSVLYRNFNSGGGKEVYVDNSDIALQLNGASNDINYALGSGQRTITFEYDGASASKTLKSVYTRGTSTVTTSETYTIDLGDLNYLAFEVLNNPSGPGAAVVTITNVVVSKGGTTFTPNPAIATLGSAGALEQRYAIGEDLTGGFKVTANLNISGTPGGGDSHQVLMKVGFSTPSDLEAPIVSNVHLTPLTPLLNGMADVEANVDDTDRGGNTIASADYSLDPPNSWLAMAASDTIFNQVMEDVVATIGPLNPVGEHTVCVRGTDSAGNQSGLDPIANDENNPCVDFIVAYAFDGFDQPIDNENLNGAQAGRAVPFKWRLTDATGDPISDPASFVRLFSYLIDCDTLGGEIFDSVEEYAAGNSGLQYNGDGYWQFNWKTPKTYASTCRAAYLEFNSTQISRVVTFKFKK
ncbi:MAG TPA: PxKF domain-containing protein [Vicinamibacterales bacterium]|nr:PxKF domain-containing protein [Vicinamibacterales bacterium]